MGVLRSMECMCAVLLMNLVLLCVRSSDMETLDKRGLSVIQFEGALIDTVYSKMMLEVTICSYC